MKKIPVGILGATGMVGQRFITLLANHPWFEVVCVAASPRSRGKTYAHAVKGRWVMEAAIPSSVADLTVFAVLDDIKKIAGSVGLVFSALDMEKDKIKDIENAYAACNIPVVSNNSAHRWTEDVPMIIPEVNPGHLELIRIQQKNHGWKKGFVVVKPNCSIQSYIPQITALWEFQPEHVIVTTLQAVSGAGKTLAQWPEMNGNVIPYIGGEEKKSEEEPKKIWASFINNQLRYAQKPVISATCIRVPVENGHMASVSIQFDKKPRRKEIIDAWTYYQNPLDGLGLPSAPDPFLTVFPEDDRPQTRIDCEVGKGMGISVGRLREDRVFDYTFIGLSHNTIRGAAGGAILTAELLKAKGYL